MNMTGNDNEPLCTFLVHPDLDNGGHEVWFIRASDPLDAILRALNMLRDDGG